MFGETLDGKLLLLLLSNFSGNSSMLFRVRTMRFCFLRQNVGSNFFGGKFCFPPKFFCFEILTEHVKDASRKAFIFKRKGKRNFNLAFIFGSWTYLLYTLLPRFFAKSKKWGRKLFFSRFLNLAFWGV